MEDKELPEEAQSDRNRFYTLENPENRPYSLPLFPPGLWGVMQLVCLVGQDDVPVVHQPSSPADRGDSRVISNQRQGPPAKASAVATSCARKGHVRVLVDLDVTDGVVVGRVWAHAAPADGGWVAAWRPADALGGGGSMGTHHRATMFLVEGGQHGSGRRERRETGEGLEMLSKETP